MLHQIVSIFDNKAEAYLRPVTVPTDAAAVRSFKDAVNDETTEYNKHPADYSINNIGSWNDATAEFIPTHTGKPIELAKASILLDEAA